MPKTAPKGAVFCHLFIGIETYAASMAPTRMPTTCKLAVLGKKHHDGLLAYKSNSD